MALKNKQLIIQWIIDSPKASKRDTATHFGISIDCVARLRREAKKTALAKTTDPLLTKHNIQQIKTCKPHPTKPHIQDKELVSNGSIDNLTKPHIQDKELLRNAKIQDKDMVSNVRVETKEVQPNEPVEETWAEWFKKSEHQRKTRTGKYTRSYGRAFREIE